MSEGDGFKTAKQLEEQRRPIVESKIRKSKDGKWIIHETIITDIKPATYYEKVLQRDKK